MKSAGIAVWLSVTTLLMLGQGCTVSFPQIDALKEMAADRQQRKLLDVRAYQWELVYGDYGTTMLAVQDGIGRVKFQSEYDEVRFDGRFVTAARELGQFEAQWHVAVGQEGIHSLYKNGRFNVSLKCDDWEKREGRFLFDSAQLEPLTILYTQVCTSSRGNEYVNAVGLTAEGVTSYIHQYFNESLIPLTLFRSALFVD